MANYELKPMDIGDILDVAFRLFRSHFATFLIIALSVYVPYAILVALLGGAPGGGGPPGPEGPNGPGAAFASNMVLTFLFTFILLPLCHGALVHNISARYLGQELGASEAYGRALPRLLPLLGANILSGVVIMLGFVLLIVPGVIFSLWFMLVTPVIMMERKGVIDSLKRSRELMQSNLGKGFLLALVILVLQFIFQMIVGGVMATLPIDVPALEAFILNVTKALILPIQLAPVILLYYDLRIRKEGFDLEQLASQSTKAS